MYFIGLNGSGYEHNANRNMGACTPTRAKTLEGAKRAAVKLAKTQNGVPFVGVKYALSGGASSIRMVCYRGETGWRNPG